MTLTMRPYVGDADLSLVTDLIGATPPTGRYLVDFPWRLSSPALQSASDVHLWATPDGALVGFAAWQVWWATLDIYVSSVRIYPHTSFS